MDNSEKAVQVYDKIAKTYANEFSKPSEHIDEFLKYMPTNGKLLDAGCGNGVDSVYVKKLGFDVVGVDMSEKMLEIARSKYPEIDFRQGDMRKLGFKENELDGIIASCSLIHIPKKDVLKTLQQFARFLKKEGVIYIQLQSGKSEEIFIEEPFKPDEKLFLNIFSLTEIECCLVKAGFNIIRKYERKSQKNEELEFTKLYVIAQKKRE
ncbi:class I SAM-dependent methyltransferase [Patescibacteria group bacterium]|nr:class I SAM-dependent methyltransferase [Patescibacteria group bacterium]